MPLDGVYLYKLKDELSCLKEAHIDKIYQPSKDELVFLLRSKEGAFRLLISAKQGAARIHLTSSKPENPSSPPMFCMLLRKHLSSAKLIDITQNGFERVITLVFSGKNEMGDTVLLNLVCEFIGSKPNVILLNQNGIITDALHRSDIETSSRLIQPGARYKDIEATDKLNILNVSLDTVLQKICSNNNFPLWKAVLNAIEGFSPLTAREIAFYCCNDIEKRPEELTQTQRAELKIALNNIIKDITERTNPVIIGDTSPKDFSFTNIKQYEPEYTSKTFNSFSEALDTFYSSREHTLRIKQNAHDLYKHLTLLISRTKRKTELRKEELKKCSDREKFRIYGELIKANLYRIKSGLSYFEAENYYDENCALITIPLDPSISPVANADKYFKEYKKSYTAEKMLTSLIEKDRLDLEYFESVLDSITRADSIAELNEIRQELADTGIIYINRNVKKAKPDNTFREYASKNGMKILVGKNNRQNDLLTLSVASKQDIWFHTKNIPGSHTVLITNGQPVDEETLIFTASIAAFHSKATLSSSVPVDYTMIKFVKKPSGAKPGMVIYTNEKTLFVTPPKNLNSSLT